MAQYSWIVILIPLIPLIGFLVNAAVIRSERAAGLVASVACGLAFVATLAAMLVLRDTPEEVGRINLTLWEWISLGSLRVPFGLLFDQLTAVMALLVTGVGTLIHVYSIGYMHGDVRPVRFFAYMNLFIFMMLVLVMGNNMLMLFLGWEGVGLCSFLLIGHWFDRRTVQPGINPSDAAVKAFVVNRVGDAGMLMAMMAIFAASGTLNFFPTQVGAETLPGYLEQVPNFANQLIDLGIFGSIFLSSAICMGLLLGVTGKSAQIPLFVWLPDAMAGPTPVSALIHAATMVTSGIYLMVRNHALFVTSDSAQGWVVAIGVITAMLAALAAVSQFDIKRVLAYSTISQLGYMVAAVGMGALTAAMFHLLTHGIFKALLFLAAGSLIHGMHDNQDMRRMGDLKTPMRTTYLTYMAGALALAGIFPFAGFWSKDDIISYTWFNAGVGTGRPGIAMLLIGASLITAFYMGRQIAMVFFGRLREPGIHPHESPRIMTVPLIILAIGALFGGLINLPWFPFLADYLEPVTGEAHTALPAGQFVLAGITTVLAAGAFIGGWYLYARRYVQRLKVGRDDPLKRYFGDIWAGSEIGWGFDWLYHRAIERPYHGLATFLSDVFDQQGIDGVLVGGLAGSVSWLSGVQRRIQNGYIRSYALVFLIGVVIVLGYFAFRA